MRIKALTQEELNTVGELTKGTQYSTQTIIKRLEAMYSANFEEDIKSVIQDLDEVGE